MKFCSKCGNELMDEAVICPKCGCSQEFQKAQTSVEVNEKTNGMAIAGFVCSFFIPLLGWIFGGIGLNKARKLNGKGQGLSIAALVIGTVIFIVYFFNFIK